MDIRIGRPSDADLDRLALRLEAAPLTYPDVGMTAGALPPGYHHQRKSVALGTGREVYGRACEGLWAWAPHTGNGIVVRPPRLPETGATVAVCVPAGPLSMSFGCRIIDSFEEDRRSGFAYGTLPGHPETGEERFVVAMDDTERVIFAVTVCSRPQPLVLRLAGPLTMAAASRASDRYLTAMARFVEQTGR